MIRFLIKGVLRDRSRSFFPVLTVSAGVFLAVLMYSYMGGVISDMVGITARFSAGHVQVVTRAFKEISDQMPNDLALTSVNDFLDTLRKNEPGMIWTPRIRFAGLLDIPDENGETRAQGPVIGLGLGLFDPASAEHKILDIKKSIIDGKMPESSGEILISRDFAKKLGLKTGNDVTLVTSTMHGSAAYHNFKIAGLVIFGISVLDKGSIIADISDVRLALDMDDSATEILGFTKNMIYSDGEMKLYTKEFNAKYGNPEDEFSPLMTRLGEQDGIGGMIAVTGVFSSILVSFFVAIMAIVLWNSGLMNNLRRYGEIGLRLALGEHKGKLYRSLLAEAFFVGLAGAVIGTIPGILVSLYLEKAGLNIGHLMQKSSMMITDVIRARVTGTSYIIGFLPGVIAPVLGAMFSGIGIYRRQTSQLFKELET